MQKQIENGRAAYAYEQVKQFCEKNKDRTKKEYRSLVRSLPSMIQTNGYAAVIAFLYSKRLKNEPHRQVYQTIFNWLKQQEVLNNSDKELIEAVTKQTRDGYKRMTWESMSLLDWIKRFAEGMIEVESNEQQKAE
ncbi:type III-B CRISPR module-associated protein Cmr5 [Paenibacillus doosanensis]|uniref:type III-B CRISPR module-associated protein Cmr5 n=1 Tax=Paenibacillus doosanensis TaxID=1229154 RepID=UPI0021800909|nr:type III-B CRISPR module-associated protein Cmr5 [Paenibacillus doosanensis]MCS7459006.1 type III-B CRISPR module-associated protein Cmr5 [Paenibacillus doosanensis]